MSYRVTLWSIFQAVQTIQIRHRAPWCCGVRISPLYRSGGNYT